jgi:DDE superfamily endonuclease
MSLSPESLLLLQPEASAFTRPMFCHMRTLVYGTLLASGRRTVAAALRAIGRGDERHFTTYHRVLNRAVWSPFHLSRILLGLLVIAFLAPDAPLILLIDGTLERRWGRRIAYKGRFHDAVRSQSGHVVTVLRDPLGVPDAASVCTLVPSSLGLTGHQCAHPDSSDQRQTGQTASHDDTGCTAPDLARETLVSRARDRVGRRWRFCCNQPGSYVPPLAGPLCLALAVDGTTLRSCPTATPGQAGSQAQERSPPAEVD